MMSRSLRTGTILAVIALGITLAIHSDQENFEDRLGAIAFGYIFLLVVPLMVDYLPFSSPWSIARLASDYHTADKGALARGIAWIGFLVMLAIAIFSP